jgi:hypothetical protein
MRGVASILFVSMLLASSYAAAATYVDPSGRVALSHGYGFQEIVGRTQVEAGDSVVASPGGHAKIVYADGCAVDVNPGAVVAVQEASPCKAGYAAPVSGPAPVGGRPVGWYVVGAAVVGGAVAGIVIATENNGSGNHKAKPASP